MRSVNLGRWSRFVERYFNMKGGGGLSDVEPSVAMTLAFLSGVEDRYPQGWDSFQADLPIGPVAAQFSRSQIRNPAGSNVIIVVEQLTFQVSAQLTINAGVIRPATIDLTNVQSGVISNLDGRSPRPGSTAILSADTNVSGSPGAQFSPLLWSVGPNTTVQSILTVNQEIPITPGSAYICIGQTVNVATNINFRWRERTLEASELT